MANLFFTPNENRQIGAQAIIVLLGLGMMCKPATAWTDHALGTRQALGAMPFVTSAKSVKVEALESFIIAEGLHLTRLLADEEIWARSNIPHYAPRPTTLAFRPEGTSAEARASFLTALRINPSAKLTLFLQIAPGAVRSGPSFPWTEVTTLRQETVARELAYLELHEGDTAAAIDVVATASDEPDYGLDIGLWEDNDTSWGKSYGFGKQPFGNPKFENSSQAPFHIGLYHEPAVLYTLAPFLNRTFPEYRIHLYQTLAAYAFRTGHPYWGWRFAGWGLHYVQDLTQPYHTRAIPGHGLATILWANTLDQLGGHGPKADAIQKVSNRHFALENYQYHLMKAAYESGSSDEPAFAALRDRSMDATYPGWSDKSARDIVSREAAEAAEATDALLEQHMPAEYVSNSTHVFEASGTAPNLFELVEKRSPGGGSELKRGVLDLMRHFGNHSRRFIEIFSPPPP
jgi:hypothetical protein